MLLFPPTARTSFTENQGDRGDQPAQTARAWRESRPSRCRGPVYRWLLERALRLRSLFTLVVGLIRRTSPTGFGSAQRSTQFHIELFQYVLRGCHSSSGGTGELVRG